ncbi:MAG: transglutaminase domain-containing protein [bacterium]|nr:transglutaminase domain-containing protein [bacterium]
MKIILLMLLLAFPLREVVNVKLTIPMEQQEIFFNYKNDNFSQKIFYDDNNHKVTAYIKNSNYVYLDLNFRIYPRKKALSALHPDLRRRVVKMLDDNFSFKSYFKSISVFLTENIVYSEADIPQDVTSVFLNKRASCVGYSNLVKALLDSAGVKNKIVKGFYLKKGPYRKSRRRIGRIMIPIPHRWLEIHLANGSRFFYDPQHQTFSENYIATKSDTNFKKVKKFKVNIVKKYKKLIN